MTGNFLVISNHKMTLADSKWCSQFKSKLKLPTKENVSSNNFYFTKGHNESNGGIE